MASPRAHARDQAACALSLRPRRAREHEEEAAKASASLAGTLASLAGFRTRFESAEHQVAAPNPDRPDLLYKLADITGRVARDGEFPVTVGPRATERKGAWERGLGKVEGAAMPASLCR